MTTHVKICGITSVDDALMSVEAGASALGLNFIESSPRRVEVAAARAISRALASLDTKPPLVVGVVADLDLDSMRRLVGEAELGCLQLHGHEDPATLAPLLPHAYKAVRVASPEDVADAERYGGEYLLVDAKVTGALGGTGVTFDWSLVQALATRRRLTVAGGLNPGNVADAIAAVRPFAVDVASGVERRPGVKDEALVRAFIQAARSA